MFGECHAHVLMDGINYRQAVERHKKDLRRKQSENVWKPIGKPGFLLCGTEEITVVFPCWPKNLRRNTGSITEPLYLRFIKKAIMEVSWEKAFPI